jgi:hypothetical protein
MPQIDWTRILAEIGLETPGYQETLERCRANLALKKAAIQLKIQEKAKPKPRLKRGKR